MPRPHASCGVRVTCDVGYLCANFSLHKPLCSRLRPDVRDRQMADVRRTSSLNAPCPRSGVILKMHLQSRLIIYGAENVRMIFQTVILCGRKRLPPLTYIVWVKRCQLKSLR